MSESEKKIKELKEIEEKIALKKKDFDKMMDEIKPFTRESEILFVSTKGDWRDGTSIFELERLSSRSSHKKD